MPPLQSSLSATELRANMVMQNGSHVNTAHPPVRPSIRKKPNIVQRGLSSMQRRFGSLYDRLQSAVPNEPNPDDEPEFDDVPPRDQADSGEVQVPEYDFVDTLNIDDYPTLEQIIMIGGYTKDSALAEQILEDMNIPAMTEIPVMEKPERTNTVEFIDHPDLPRIQLAMLIRHTFTRGLYRDIVQSEIAEEPFDHERLTNSAIQAELKKLASLLEEGDEFRHLTPDDPIFGIAIRDTIEEVRERRTKMKESA